MIIRSRELASPVAQRSVPHGRPLDLLASTAFVASGPALWCFGAVILSDQRDPGMQLVQIRNLHGIEAAEALLGLLAAASGLLISVGACIAVLAALTQQVARRCGAWQMERMLSKLSPGFLRRSAALTLGAGLALTVVAADSWPRATVTEAASVQQDEAAGEAGGDPDSVLFDTAEPEDAPSPEPEDAPSPELERPQRPGSVHEPDALPGQDLAPDPDRCAGSGTGEPSSGLSRPEAPNSDRLQGVPQRRGAEPEQVVVRLGDSLWDIAADHLGADATDWEIAASWPKWYEANRERIGADPGVILPGTILSVPST